METKSGQRSVFVAFGNLCDNFTMNLKYLSHHVILKYCVKKRIYSCKVTILAKNREKDETIFYSLIKIRSPPEIALLNSVLSGMEEYLHKYIKIQSGSESDWNLYQYRHSTCT